MRKFVCDRCENTVVALYVFPIEFVGEARIGGTSLTWDGPMGIMDRGDRRGSFELCRSCANKLVEACGPVVGNKDLSVPREALADYAHEAWSGWMKYLLGKCEQHNGADGRVYVTIPDGLIERWDRQMSTPYADLPEEEKETDRDEANKILAITNTAEKFTR